MRGSTFSLSLMFHMLLLACLCLCFKRLSFLVLPVFRSLFHLLVIIRFCFMRVSPLLSLSLMFHMLLLACLCFKRLSTRIARQGKTICTFYQRISLIVSSPCRTSDFVLCEFHPFSLSLSCFTCSYLRDCVLRDSRLESHAQGKSRSDGDHGKGEKRRNWRGGERKR